jgi:hypothetical protein
MQNQDVLNVPSTAAPAGRYSRDLCSEFFIYHQVSRRLLCVPVTFDR